MKRFFSILLCLALFSTLVACGGGTDDDAAESQGIEQSEQSGDTEAKTSGLKIAYSVGYVGNAWRSQHVASLEEAADYMRAHAQPGDLILTMGCGNINRVADMLVGK